MSKLVRCKACGNEVAKGVKKCPNCGKDNRSFVARHKILSAIAVLVILGGIGGAMSEGEDGKTVETKVVKEEREIEYLVTTMDDLKNSLENNALNAKETFEGEYLEVSGYVGVIDSDGKYITLRDSNIYSLSSLQVSVSKDLLSDIATLSTDQLVTIRVKITEVGEVIGYYGKLIEIVK